MHTPCFKSYDSSVRVIPIHWPTSGSPWGSERNNAWSLPPAGQKMAKG